MRRYVAFLRGVTPMNAKMSELKASFEKMGFTEVQAVLFSGNVVFTSAAKQKVSLVKAIESGITTYLPRSFPVIVRPVDHLLALPKADPYSGFRISPKAKRVVTFLSQPHRGELSLPIELDDAQILCMKGREVFTAYVPNERGPVFMILIEMTFGKNVTTRTWETVRKCVSE